MSELLYAFLFFIFYLFLLIWGVGGGGGVAGESIWPYMSLKYMRLVFMVQLH